MMMNLINNYYQECKIKLSLFSKLLLLKNLLIKIHKNNNKLSLYKLLIFSL